jgi:precorrin-6B methylase 2
MVFDDLRNGLYAKAIRERVTRESVVLDLGAGLGIHGLLAAAAGARRVYLVDAEPVVRVAMEAARANGLADRITVVEGRIEDVTVPEPVDLIVSVFTGNLLFSEDLLPSLFHARDHYLKQGGTMVPDLAELMAAPVSAPAMHAKYVSGWSAPAHDLNYSAARRFACNEIQWLRPGEVEAIHLSAGGPLARVDLMTETYADCHGTHEFEAASSGMCHGLLGWIRIRLGSEWLSTNPQDQEGQEVHWAIAFLPWDEPLELVAGERVSVGLVRPQGGDWIWSVQARAGARKQSSFLANPDAANRLQHVAPGFTPVLGAQGRVVQLVLQSMDGKRTNLEVAELLVRAEPGAFQTLEEAMRTVQSLARRYTARR